MEYKLSKCTVMCEDCEWVRLYNSLKGTDSFLMVPKQTFIYLKSKKYESISHQNLIHQLVEMGHLIPMSRNEDETIQAEIIRQINEPVLRLIIMPTERCSFRCQYCYEEFKNGKMTEELQKGIIKFVEENLDKYTALDVRWFGGEPLEALDVIEGLSKEFLAICRAKHKRYESSITTNGYYLTFENFRRLFSLHVLNYQVTLDGIRDIHDRQRFLAGNIGTYDRIVSNLLSIKRWCRSQKPFITIRVNLTREAIERVDEVIGFFSDNFADDPRFGFSLQRVADWGGERVEEMKEELVSVNAYESMLDSLKKNSFKLSLRPHAALFDADNAVCYAARKNSFVIGSEGTVYKCTADFRMKENNIGKLLENGQMELNPEKADRCSDAWMKTSQDCRRCAFEGACLRNSCPSGILKGTALPGDCLLEKKYVKQYLRLFDESWFLKWKENESHEST